MQSKTFNNLFEIIQSDHVNLDLSNGTFKQPYDFKNIVLLIDEKPSLNKDFKSALCRKNLGLLTGFEFRYIRETIKMLEDRLA